MKIVVILKLLIHIRLLENPSYPTVSELILVLLPRRFETPRHFKPFGGLRSLMLQIIAISIML